MGSESTFLWKRRWLHAQSHLGRPIPRSRLRPHLILLHLLSELFAELCELRTHHVRAIGLGRIPGEIFLVIIFSYIERQGRYKLRDNRIVEHLLARELRNDLFRGGFLFK